MYPQSHFLFALFISMIFVKYGVFDYRIALLIAVLAVFVDIDHLINFIIKKKDYSIRDAWNAGIIGHMKERTFIHHYLGFILITGIIVLLFFLNRTWFWIILIAYYSHMFLDYAKLNILKIRGRITIKEAGFVEKINKFELLFDFFLVIGIALLII
jgi:hypothetical protein